MLKYKFLVLSVIGAISIGTPASAQSDISSSMCQSYMAIVERATELSQQGVPISVAHKMADSALNLNPQLWNFLIGAINFAYKDSKSTEAAIADGRMQKICVDALMGR